MNYVGNKLRNIRKVNNLTQESLSVILGTNRIRISNIENDKTEMTFNEAINLCQKFNISADSFFEEHNLSSKDYITISNRYIHNKSISETERREVLKKIHITFEELAFNDISTINVLENNNINKNNVKCKKYDMDKYTK